MHNTDIKMLFIILFLYLIEPFDFVSIKKIFRSPIFIFQHFLLSHWIYPRPRKINKANVPLNPAAPFLMRFILLVYLVKAHPAQPVCANRIFCYGSAGENKQIYEYYVISNNISKMDLTMRQG